MLFSGILNMQIWLLLSSVFRKLFLVHFSATYRKHTSLVHGFQLHTRVLRVLNVQGCIIPGRGPPGNQEKSQGCSALAFLWLVTASNVLNLSDYTCDTALPKALLWFGSRCFLRVLCAQRWDFWKVIELWRHLAVLLSGGGAWPLGDDQMDIAPYSQSSMLPDLHHVFFLCVSLQTWTETIRQNKTLFL